MNYIQQAFKNNHDGWLYFSGLLITFVAWQIIGSIPLVIALLIKMMTADAGIPTDIPGMIAILGKNMFLFLMLISFAIGLVGLLLTTKFLHKQSFKNLTTARSKIDWSRTIFMFVLWAIFSIGSTVLAYYLSPQDYEVQFNLGPFLILFALTIVLMPLQTSFEEYLFRGYLMQGLGIKFKNRWLPLLLTSVGFGLLHGANPEAAALGPIVMIFYIGTGLILGIMTLMDEGLELALGFHAANNMCIALLVTTDWSALQTHAVLKNTLPPEEMALSELLVPVFVIYPLVLFILSKKYGWTNWKEKLFGKVVAPIAPNYRVLPSENTTDTI